ncbi:MAG: phosphoglucosamine mutase [Epsilonproteobacteria bacterium]|jgi:phosphoglucosamine mutase|uniref:phosphoglucosamine mutase n=1 Tax=Sulfurospirillum TaxID=57665 RepID=UPI0005AAE6FF|nr:MULTISPECIES: phosphoglucosamine mutase [Sulfurospirillum]MCP3652445.1 phosphoglucosamine mutase [Sulfurospirillum sp. DNRA8]MCR1811296.1 phosphoglucosamine mutase [Sulfurospirillum sp. DNRA8]NCB54022.1 phosphoglucosamine mutase [Campylobacterota bacterium]
MKLFGTDGVRGKAGKKLSAFLAMRLAMAAGIYFRKNSITNKILVGKDTRRSGYMIENAIVSGLTAVGYDVRQIGPMPTPAIAFLTEDMRCDAGIMISASHNPFSDNGIKFFDSLGNKLGEAEEAEIEKIYFDDELIEKNQKTEFEIGRSKRIDDVIGRYIVQIKNSFPKHLTLKGFRIVLDPANGAAYKVAPTVFSELGADVIMINDDPNGSNINLNCGALHPEELGEEVRRLRADIGFAFDGDADRLVVVDENGNPIHGDMLLGKLATFLQSQNRLTNNGVCVTVMSNQALEDYLAKSNIKTYRCDVGDKNVLECLYRQNINFGGEQSGHIIVSDFAKTGDALVASLAVMHCVLTEKQKVSRLFNPFILYPQLQHNLKVDNKIPLLELQGYDALIQEFQSKQLRVLIRYSGTENLLRILLEGKDEQVLEASMEKAVAFFKSALNE